jgi:outer membrane protein assembly factor BamB
MYRHDPQHTGCSTSAAPKKNQTIWVKQFGDWVRSSPAVHNNVVFIGSDENKLYALNATTGAEIWKYTMGADIESSAAIGYNRVYVGSSAPDYRIYCLNETNGMLLWSFRTAGSITSSPCLSDNKVLFGSDDGKLYCLEATTGNHLWNFSTGGRVRSSPAVAYGKVFFGSFDSKVYALDLNNGRLIWSYTTDGSVTTSPSFVDGKVFVSTCNKIICLNVLSGDLIWNYTTSSLHYSSPAIAGGNVYVGCNDHKMYCLNAADGALKWNYTTGGQIYSSPAVADGKVYFGSFDFKVYCLNATTGTMIWSYYTGGNILTSSPAVVGQVVYVASSYDGFTGRLFAFGRTGNNPPLVTNLEIKPSLPVTTDNLIGSYDYFDEDEDHESGTEIRWYKDGVLQPIYSDALFVSSSDTTKGQQWYFTVRPKDGINFGELQTSPSLIIQNSPPSIDNVTIIPYPAYANDTLIANPIGWFDVDGDIERYSYQWQKYEAGNWENISGATNQSLSSNNFVKDDLLRILCTPYDGEAYGSTKEAIITISNSLPTINSYHPLINPTIFEGETQEFIIAKFDVDLDPLTVEWYLNGTKVSEGSDSYIYVSNFESAGTYNITVIISDGIGQTEHEWLLTVADVKRDLAVTAITVSKTIVGQNYSLQINVTVENYGDFSEVSNVTIYAEATIIGIISDVTILSGNSAIVTFTWNTTGFAKGNYTISAYAWTVLDEINTSDNTLTDGWVIITTPADINGDRSVNFLDAIMLGIAFGSQPNSPNWNPNADLICDFTINYLDTIILGAHFGEADP